MKNCVIAISSLTYALKAEKILNAHDIRNNIVKLSVGQTKRGCAYGIRLDYINTQNAYAQLEKNAIPAGELIFI